MDKIVFLHIHKTGGTSLHEFLLTQFPNDRVCPERFNHLEEYTKEQLAGYEFFSGHFTARSIDRIDGPKKVFTFLREPKARVLSLYYFWKSHKEEIIEKGIHGPRLARSMPLIEFLRHGVSGIDNYTARTLAGRSRPGSEYRGMESEARLVADAKHTLDQMTTYGLFEDFERSFCLAVSDLGFDPPATIPHALNSMKLDRRRFEMTAREPVSEEVDEELERLTHLDKEVYEYALARFQERADVHR